MATLSLTATGLVYKADPAAAPIIDLPSLDAKAGELVVLSGPSGSGKSTLLYLLSGLLVPTQGGILWGDVDLATLTESRSDVWRRTHAGFVFQNFHLIDELSPIDNVLVTAWFARFSSGALRERAKTLLQDLAVPHARKTAALLSRGEQQRVAIARALLHNPAVIFADEPTASLDATSGALVIAILKRLATEQGRAVIVASHDPALIAMADRVVALDHGKFGQKAAA